jgi:hypothetical protein
MIKKILVVLVVAVGAVLAYAAMQPDTFSLQRSASIAATPEQVYPLIADLKAFNTWNPWLRKDPSSKLTYSGPPQGIGSAYAWESAEQQGGGQAGVSQADGRLQPRGVHLAAARHADRRDVDDERTDALPVQADVRVRQHGPDGGPGLRSRPGEPEVRRGEALSERGLGTHMASATRPTRVNQHRGR